ncbi:hypothetical protein [Wenjunlia tyrosinilytica]|uniref:GAF domain-containing protein n=1 Tax=Wenjunlia tyrosinilytica TaxID=1544741 RepID=A0A917ZW85_9ACTN|nr:hypothetical protein [Wenjunlia tyrosinilytica]GGO97507.1 hypothetical protein GCM10012280_59490 [Wenjunlia tyrosinilytica]
MACLAAATAYVLQGWERWQFALSGGVCAALAILLPIRETRKKDEALVAANKRADAASSDARAQEKRRLFFALEPLAKELVTLTGKEHADPGDTKRHLKQMVAHTIAPMMGESVRLAFFKYELAPRRLVFDAVSHGRNGKPGIEFRRKNKPGRTVLEYMLNANQPAVFVAKVQAPSAEEDVEPPPGWAIQHEYESFAAAAIRRADPKLHGIITLDSPNQGILTKEDADILAIIGHLVAAGLQAAERTPTPPRVGENSSTP